MTEDTITQDELRDGVKFGIVYVVGAAAVNAVILWMFQNVLLAALEDLSFLVSLLSYALIGWGAGVAMKRAFHDPEQLPVRLFALGLVLPGIALCLFFMQLLTLMSMASGLLFTDPLLVFTSFFHNLTSLGQAALSFEYPVESILMLMQPVIAFGFAWQSITERAASHDN